ncbi:uncharacterized protein CIMG_07666 [Coccidioides immitis RS]|uniref:Uncharacterized protein n=1 Tax=Coccidioides immitis (strain RS) TaxID=246410 RepID=J3K3V6_COCIM|nr:uncharacterized protein CIMG_07666 [Coccidioides immitis RS]EAS28920.3 hypothetical protein CIMG_07666 [Coccidioides immitis RS]TPX22901.1 hypothetical protein DIZ76_014782 [Coccidioides immitis]
MGKTNKPTTENPDYTLVPVVSHGRGGQGNIHPDSTVYADGAITRQGEEGDQGDGAYSVGRGGAGNIGPRGVKPTSQTPRDVDIIPPLAIRPSMEGDYHVGRGGLGNISHGLDRKKETLQPDLPRVQERKDMDVQIDHDDCTGLADKLKYKIFGWR